MKTSQDTIDKFLSAPNVRFSIPVYQRNYAWKKEQCQKLLDDIIQIAKDTHKKHFIGTITYIIHHIQDQNGLIPINEFVIIDGQQRITTIMLLLKAISNKSNDQNLQNRVARILNDDNSSKLRLKPIRRDRDAFICVLEGRENEYSGDSNIKDNYRFFLNAIDKYLEKGYKIEEIYSAFLRLEVVGIGLEKGDDDPQVVFESINATGVHLEGIDLIRNYLMMGEDSHKQETLYNDYWMPIENYLPKENLMQKFIEIYLRMYDGINVKQDNIYEDFKKHHKINFSNDIVSLIDDMRNYARIYQVFDSSDFRFNNDLVSQKDLAILRQKIHIFRDIKFGTSYPFIMRLINDFENGKLDVGDFKSMLDVLISYFVRRAVCGESSNVITKAMYDCYKSLGDDISA